MTEIRKKQLHVLVAAVICILINIFLKPENGLSSEGVRLLSVFAATVYIWLCIGGNGWSALLSISAAVLLGVYDGNLSFQLLWGTSLVAFAIPFFMLASVLESSGAILYIVQWILSRKIVHGRPRVFMLLYTLSLLIVNAFTHPFVVVLIFFKKLRLITKGIGETLDGDFYKCFGMLIGWITQFSDATLIWVRPWISSMVVVIAGYGFSHFDIYCYFRISGIYILTATAILLLIINFWIKPDLSKLKNFDDARLRAQLKEKPLSKKGKVTLGGMAVVIIYYILASIRGLGAFAAYLNSLPIAVVISIVTAVLCFVTVDGEPVMDLPEAAKSVPWDQVLFLGAIMFYATIFGNEEYGITLFLQNMLAPVASQFPTTLIMLFALTVICIFTNLASNSVSVIVGSASFIPALMNMPGVSMATVLSFGASIIMVSGTAICTRNACGVMGLTYGKEGIEWKGTRKYSIALCAIMVLLCTFVFIPLGSVLLADGV